MQWTGGLPAGKTYPFRVSTLDVLPTCLEAAGIPIGQPAKVDGESFLQAVRTGGPSPTERRPLFGLLNNRWAVVSGEWKLVRTNGPGGPPARQILYDGDSADAKPALFHLNKDPARAGVVFERESVASGKTESAIRRLAPGNADGSDGETARRVFRPKLISSRDAFCARIARSL